MPDTAAWTPQDIVTACVAAYAAAVATLNFLWPRLNELREKRTATFRALKGEKEAVAEIAFQIASGKRKNAIGRPRFRQQLIHSLSNALIMESSDRAKAYVLAALLEISKQKHKQEVVDQLENMSQTLIDYNNVIPDEDFKAKRIDRVRTVIDHIKQNS